jgi:hypothetical protein
MGGGWWVMGDADDRVFSFLGDFDEVVEAEFFGEVEGEAVGAAEGVAVVLNEPEVVFFAEGKGGGEVEGIAEGVSHHDGFGLAGRVCGFELGAVGIARDGVGIDENGHGPDLR